MRLVLFTMHGCPRCPKAREIARKVAEEHGLDLVEVDMRTLEGQIEALMYNVCTAPTLLLTDDDFHVLFIVPGREPTAEDVERLKDILREVAASEAERPAGQAS